MGTKLDQLRSAILQCDYDVIILIETWLNQNYSDNELASSEYQIFRLDRNSRTSTKQRGGGVLMLVHNQFKAKQLRTDILNVEHIFVQVDYGELSYVMGGVYIPPNSAEEVYRAHCLAVESIKDNFPNIPVFLFGDYNLPLATWNYSIEEGLLVECAQTYPAKIVCESFSYLNMRQSNIIPNDHGVFLDLIFNSIDECHKISVQRALDTLLPNNFHHVATICDIRVSDRIKRLDYSTTYFDFRNADFVGLNDYFSLVDWSSIFDYFNIDNSVNNFYEVVLYAISLYVPNKTYKPSRFPRWFSPELKNLILSKKAAHAKFKHTHLAGDYIVFANLRTQCKVLTEQCYRSYIATLSESIHSDTTQFWNHINSLNKNHGIPNSMRFNGLSAESGEDIANLFASYFSSVYRSDVVDLTNFNFPVENSVDIPFIQFTLSEVFESIISLKDKLSYGPDNIPTYFLKRCVYSLSGPLCTLFNLSLKLQTFPEKWRDSFITPVFKNGDRDDIRNYRPVVMLSAIPKLFELILNKYLTWHCRGLLINEQHGFRQGKSASTNLVLYHDFIVRAFEKGYQVDSIYTDFSRAFDTVIHSLLIFKLRKYGFPEWFLSWLNSYLHNRIQFVNIKGSLSVPILVTSGVPQGSHVGPLLFNIFINDIFSIIRFCQFLLFADDLKLFLHISNLSDCLMIQSDIDSLYNWSVSNGLHLNKDKCFIISFTKSRIVVPFDYHINGNILSRVSQIKDLGVLFDSSLTFIPHIDSLSGKALRTLGFITRNSQDLSIAAFRVLYLTLIRSVMSYASIVWSPYYANHIFSLEKVQNKFLRTCAWRLNLRDASLLELRSRLNITSLEDYRTRCDVVFLHKLVNSAIDCPELLMRINFRCNTRVLREMSLFLVECHHTNYGKFSPINRLHMLGNAFNHVFDLVGLKPSKLKRCLSEFTR